ncbi:MAG: copper transporter [bacterium]
MRPIDIKYHVVSLVAVFLALGVGIIVGSNSNLIGTNTIIDRQNMIISRLEKNFDEQREEMKNTKAFLKETGEYVQTLETKTIPALLRGKFDGMRFGMVNVGAFDAGNQPTEHILTTLKTAGAAQGFILNINLEFISEMAGDDADNFLPRIAGELVNGAAYGSSITGEFIKNDHLASGDFKQPVNCVVFVLGENLDQKLIQDILIPLELQIRKWQSITENITAGENEIYRRIFSGSTLSFYQGAETLPGRIEFAADLAEKYSQLKDMEKK